jgi:predicted  nucleic acid-binding Zn-ribbon protein
LVPNVAFPFAQPSEDSWDARVGPWFGAAAAAAVTDSDAEADAEAAAEADAAAAAAAEAAAAAAADLESTQSPRCSGLDLRWEGRYEPPEFFDK